MKLTKKRLKEIEEHDNRSVAYHEAAHGIVAVALGVDTVYLTIHSQPTTLLELERGWAGKAASHGFSRLGKLNRAAMAIAGCIAELLLEDFDADVAAIVENLEIDWDCLSDTDKRDFEAIHVSWRIRAIEKALSVLRRHWNAVEDVAVSLKCNKDGRALVHKYILSKEHAETMRSPEYVVMRKREIAYSKRFAPKYRAAKVA